jgi:MFS family permease
MELLNTRESYYDGSTAIDVFHSPERDRSSSRPCRPESTPGIHARNPRPASVDRKDIVVTTNEFAPVNADRSNPAAATKVWTRELPKMVGALFLAFSAFGIAVPVLPALITSRLHGTPFAVGLAFAINAVAALLTRPSAGQLAQRLGTRPVMLLGCAVAAVSPVLYLLPLGIPGILVGRILMGLGSALLFVAGSVWTVASAPPGQRGQIVGYYGLGPWAGLAAGPILGGVVLHYGSFPLAWSTAALLPLGSLLLVWWLPNVAGQGAQTSRRLLPRAALMPGLALGAGAFGYGTVTSFGALALKAHGLGSGSLALGLFSASYLATRLCTSRLPDRVGAIRLIVASAAAESVGLAATGLAPYLWLALLGTILAGAGYTLFQPVLALITIDNAPASERGAALGAMTSFLDIGVACAGLTGGVIADARNPAATFLVGSAIALTAIIAAAVAVRRGAAGHD